MNLKKYFDPTLPTAIRMSMVSLTLASAVALPFTAWPEDPLPPIDPIWNRAKIEPERTKKGKKNGNEATRATVGTSVATDEPEETIIIESSSKEESHIIKKEVKKSTDEDRKDSKPLLDLTDSEMETLRGDVVKGEYFPTYIKAANSGDAEGMRLVGICYLYGTGTEKNEKQAWEWIGKAASAGDTEAQYNLGCLYRDGTGVKQNFTESAYWFRRAARNGNAKAMINIARQFAEGKGVLQDYRIAAENFWRAAERGEVEGMYQYAVMLRDGIGVERDQKKALKWFEKAAALDYKDSSSQAEILRKSAGGNSNRRNSDKNDSQIGKRKR